MGPAQYTPAQGKHCRSFCTGGTPCYPLPGGTPSLLGGGTPPWVPPSDLVEGYPIPARRYPTLGNPPIGPGWGNPPIRSGWGTSHQTWLGYPPSVRPGWGTPLHLDLAGVPPPPVDRQIGWTDTCQNITFPRTTYAVGNNTLLNYPV